MADRARGHLLDVGGVHLDDISVNRHFPQVGADTALCGAGLIFSSMSRFSSSVTQNFIWMFRFRFAMCARLRFFIRVWDYPSKQFFVFRGRGPPKPKIRKWVLTGCACYRNPTLVFSLY